MERQVREAILLDFYGALLPEKRRRVFELYVNDDLSLAEIAQMLSISRQGAHYYVRSTAKQLEDWESSAGFQARYERRRARLEDICAKLERMDGGSEMAGIIGELRALEDMDDGV